jgi:hypothetical protein
LLIGQILFHSYILKSFVILLKKKKSAPILVADQHRITFAGQATTNGKKKPFSPASAVICHASAPGYQNLSLRSTNKLN